MVDEVVERAAFVAEAKRRGWTPGDFMLGAYAGWLAAKNLAASPQAPAPQAVVGEASERVDASEQVAAIERALEAYESATNGEQEAFGRRAVMNAAGPDELRIILDALAAALTPSPAPSATPHQGADALREAIDEAKERLLFEAGGFVTTKTDGTWSERTWKAWRGWIARAALAHHQAPQQGEQG